MTDDPPFMAIAFIVSILLVIAGSALVINAKPTPKMSIEYENQLFGDIGGTLLLAGIGLLVGILVVSQRKKLGIL